jgi:hypothetical protein
MTNLGLPDVQDSRVRRMPSRLCLALVALLLALSGTTAQAATPESRWLPSPPGASWTWTWSNDAYAQTATLERYTVSTRTDDGFRLAWTTSGLDNAAEAVSSTGTVDYRYTDAGLVNTNWNSSAPPERYPVLCAGASECGNSLAGAHYLIIWGSRSPLLQEPLVKGSTWGSLGGQASDVSSVNRYRGVERVVTEAFPKGVLAAKIETEVTQLGALGDPFGSGLRTTWWVYGVGPVKVIYRHAGGQISYADLKATNLQPKLPPSDVSYLPLNRGATAKFRYTNSKWLKQPSVQKTTVAEVVNNSARVDVESVSGPVRLKGSYVFATRATGVTNLQAATSAATRLKFPILGPGRLPVSQRRRFLTPLDLMTYGYNPVLPAYAAQGQTWKSSTNNRDFQVFGVTGRTKVLGRRLVTTPAGRFRALVVSSKLTQAGFRYGSGTRTSWFAPGVGLVKLRFVHKDGSVSTVVRVP